MTDQSEQNALVIGGGTGIGRGTACALAAAGYRCAIAGRRVDKLAKAAADFDGGELLYHGVDVACRDSVGELIAWFGDALGPIDVLVNAAGKNIRNRSMAEMTPDQWDEILAINATGAYNCLHAVLPEMRRRRTGVIIQIDSVAGKRAIEVAGVAYTASKFAMTALGTAVAREEAQHGIRITNIYPGEVNTPLLDERPVAVSADQRAAMLQPEDVAAMIVAICQLPPRAHVPELVIKPPQQEYC